jgi:CRP/FNR family cyclic AMP-dependent transcriptional regulator
MSSEEKIQLLRSFSLFDELSKKDLNSIAKLFQYKILPKYSNFITEGDKNTEMYFIISGLIRIYHLHESGKEMTIAMRMPGETIGEMSIIEDQPRSANAETLYESSILILTKANFVKLLKKYPLVGIHFLQILSRRLREDLELQKIISFSNLENRTYHVLQTLSPYFADTGITFSHEQLSALINATQPRVTEALHTLRKNKKIKISRKKIRVR